MSKPKPATVGADFVVIRFVRSKIDGLAHLRAPVATLTAVVNLGQSASE